MRDNLPEMLRTAAKEWREENKFVGVGETRYDAALEEAANAIEELSKQREYWELEASAQETDKNYLIDENRKLVEAWHNALALRNRLIPVTERLPEIDGDYLVWFYDAKCWKVAEFNKHTAKEGYVWWFAGIDRTKFVTHWMPLPEPPRR